MIMAMLALRERERLSLVRSRHRLEPAGMWFGLKVKRMPTRG
jgi:hypothetical protein